MTPSTATPTGYTPDVAPDSEVPARSAARLAGRFASPMLRFPAIGAAVGALVALVWAFLAPVYFYSSASILPETRSRLSGSLGGAAALLGAAAGGMLDGGTSPQFYAELFRSRSVLDYVTARRFAPAPGEAPRPLEELLIEDAPATPRRHELAVLKLRKLSSVGFDARTGIVSVGVYARSPELSRDVAQAFIDAVSEFDVRKRQTRARAEREFVERRLTEVRGQLRQAEVALRDFASGNRVVTFSPELRLSSERLQRDLTLKQEQYLATARQLEEARVNEVRDTPVFSVIDPPNVPAKKTLPKRSLILLAGLALGGLAGLLFAARSTISRAAAAALAP